MKFVIGLLLGLFLGYGAYWYVDDRRVVKEYDGRPVVSSEPESTDGNGLRDELNRTGRVIREKAEEAGEAIGDVASNTATTAAVKTKFLQDPKISALAIDVDSNDGVVTLSGKVSSYEEIERALDLAMETDGVRKVISALQVDGEVPQHN